MSRNEQGAPAPDAASLHAAAVAYLGRYSATRATLARALNRIIDRWLRAADSADAPLAAAAKRAVPEVVARLAAAGALNDAAFAESRARKLARTGHSRTATAAHLAARGVPAELVTSTLAVDEDAELAAAVTYMRRRRLGRSAPSRRRPTRGTRTSARSPAPASAARWRAAPSR